jgi:hypothetical protein
METLIQVWDDKHGCRVEVGPDRDGLDLVEIRSYADDGKLHTSIAMQPEQALLVAKAIFQLHGPDNSDWKKMALGGLKKLDKLQGTDP